MNPFADFTQVLGLRGNRHHRIGPLDRQKTHHARQRHTALRAEDFLQLRHQFANRGTLQAKYADRHAFEPVHIERVDGVLIVGQFFGRARQAQYVARRIDQQERVFPRERLEQLLHFSGRDVTQRKQPRRHARRRLRHWHFRHQLAGYGLVRGQDHVAIALLDHRVVGPRQQRLENRQRLLLVDRLGGRKAHIAFDALGNAVVLVQQVAHDAVDHRLNRLIGEVEDNVASLRRASCRSRRGLADETLVALDDLTLRRGRRLL